MNVFSVLECVSNVLDVCFIVDRSGSVKGPTSDNQLGNWQNMMVFIKEMIQMFNVGVFKVNVGILFFSSSEKVIVDIKTIGSNNKNDIFEELEKWEEVLPSGSYSLLFMIFFVLRETFSSFMVSERKSSVSGDFSKLYTQYFIKKRRIG